MPPRESRLLSSALLSKVECHKCLTDYELLGEIDAAESRAASPCAGRIQYVMCASFNEVQCRGTRSSFSPLNVHVCEPVAAFSGIKSEVKVKRD